MGKINKRVIRGRSSHWGQGEGKAKKNLKVSQICVPTFGVNMDRGKEGTSPWSDVGGCKQTDVAKRKSSSPLKTQQNPGR